MDNLEKYFDRNREAFDDAEPMSRHFARFEGKLDAEFGKNIKMSNRSMFLRIAAGFLILVAFSLFFYDFAQTRSNTGNSGMAVNNELQEALNFYDNAAASGLGTIRSIACCGKEQEQIYSLASEQIKNLDQNAAELKRVLNNNPGDERIQSALIQNKQMKEKVMNNMIDQMNKIKN